MVPFGLLLVVLAGEAAPSEADVLAYGKRLDVSRVDSRLPRERLQSWLARTLGPGASVTWTSDDCAEGGGDSAPLCISADARLYPRGRVSISIAVGSVQGGLGGKPALFFGSIEGLGPSESLETGDLPALSSKVRAAQVLGAELARLPDRPADDDAWIRQVQRLPAARFVPGASGTATFADWVAARAGSSAQTEWFVEGCGPRGHHGGPPVDLKGDKDEWAFVDVRLEEPDANVSIHVRVGTCRKGMTGQPVASPASLFDKRRGHVHIEHVPLDALEGKLGEIRAHP